MELINVVEAVTLLVTLGMTMTGIPPCRNMYQTKSTKNVPFPIFLLSAVSCAGMLHYGLMLGNNVLIFLNAVGTVMQLIYVFTFILVASPKTKSLLLLSVAIVYISVLYSYLYSSLDKTDDRANMLGLCSSRITTLIMCLPAMEIVQNIRYKNADGMPLVMLVGGALCSSCWLVYGIMLNDLNIYLPNIPGLIVTFSKLYIIALYGGSKDKTKKDD